VTFFSSVTSKNNSKAHHLMMEINFCRPLMRFSVNWKSHFGEGISELE
jgi:hypothetical protein